MDQKIFIIFFCQIRNIKATYKNIKENLLNTCPYNYDLSIFTWDDITKETEIFLNEHFNIRFFEKINFEKYKNIIFSEEKLNIAQNVRNINSHKNYLRLWGMNNIISNFIESNKINEEYSHFLQIRSDMYHIEKFPWNKLEIDKENSIFVKNIYEKNVINDEFSFGKINLYYYWGNFINCMQNYNLLNYYNRSDNAIEHSETVQYFIDNNIEIIRIEIFYLLVRKYIYENKIYYGNTERNFSEKLLKNLENENHVEWIDRSEESNEYIEIRDNSL